MKRKLFFSIAAMFIGFSVYSQNSTPANTPAPTGMPGATAGRAASSNTKQEIAKEEATPVVKGNQEKMVETPAELENKHPRTAPELPKQPGTTKENESSPN